jgi:hypothetical protein
LSPPGLPELSARFIEVCQVIIVSCASPRPFGYERDMQRAAPSDACATIIERIAR